MLKYTLILLVVGLIVIGVVAQEPMMQEKGSAQTSQQCMAMMDAHQNMMAEMERMDAKLQEMVASLKSAKGEERWTVVIAILDELVSQRKAMREKRAQMQSGMMGHMAKGMTGEARKSMMQCPMMKAMQDVTSEDIP